jgi:O-acetylhomoserine (thiol)-lyase
MTYRFDTLTLHAGQIPDTQFGARAQPVYLTNSFVFKDADHAAALFNLERGGHVHSSVSNPTCAALEERVAALEGGAGAVAAASGQAALHLAIATLTGAGGHIVASRSLHGGSMRLLKYTVPRFGVSTSFVNPRDVDAWRAEARPETRFFFGEMIGGLGLEVLDIPGVAAVAHECGVPLLVDSTLTTPCLIQPFKHGADLALHGADRFLSGHGTVTGGLIVDAGRFDWAADGRFPTLSMPDESLGGVTLTEESAVVAFLLRARHEALRDFGACLSPFNAFQILQGLETLPLRMTKHIDNARRIVAHLDQRTGEVVESVIHPDLPSHPDHALAEKLLPRGSSPVLDIHLAGGRAAGVKFVESLKVFSHLAGGGDAKSLLIHPASSTHARMSDAQLRAAGIHPGAVRLSVGLEDPEDLIEDLNRGLSAAARA